MKATLSTHLAPSQSAPAEQPTVRGTLLASATLTIMAGVTIAPSLPQMLEVFAEVPNADVLVRLVLTITALAVAFSAPLAGLFADRVGRKPLLVFSLMLYALAGVSGFFAPSLPTILIGRVLLGVAVAGIMTAVSTLIADYFEGQRRAAFLGLQAAFGSFGGVLFLPLAGWLANTDWRAPFLVYLVSLAIVPFAVLALKEARRARVAPTPKSPLAPKVDSKADTARSVVLTIYVLALVSTILYFMVPTQLPFYLERLGTAPSGTGLVIASSLLTSAVAALGYARLHRSLSFQVLAALALGLMGVGWVLIGTANTLAQVVMGVMIGGLGAGVMIPNLNVWLSSIATPERRGQLLGGLVTAIFLGQFLSPLLSQLLVTRVGLSTTFLWGGAVSLLGAALVVLAFRRTRGSSKVAL